MTTSTLNTQNIGETAVTHTDMIKRKNTLSFYKKHNFIGIHISECLTLCKSYHAN